LIPVITIDGPSGSGKSTLTQCLSEALGWHFLNSGVLYRALAHQALERNISLDDAQVLANLAQSLNIHFVASEGPPQFTRVLLDGEDITLALRSQACSSAASHIATLPAVRGALLDRQRAFCKPPGLVAEGRDMGTVVFPDAPLKLFLEASAQIRTKRRQQQLKEAGIDVNLAGLSQKIAERDIRDKARKTAPLKPAQDAQVIDTTDLSIDETLSLVLERVAVLHLGAT